MKRVILLLMLVTAVLLFGFAATVSAQEPERVSQIGVSQLAPSADVHIPSAQGRLVIPKSSMVQTPPAGHKFVAHTNIRIFMPPGVTPDELPPFRGYGFETPASLACVYDLVEAESDWKCNPNSFTSATDNPSGGSHSIAIVDAYDDPNAASDLEKFSSQFGLAYTPSQFQVVDAITNNNTVYNATTCPDCCPGYVPVDPTGGWEVEESLDIEWSHAMAPDAKIYLVEACTDYDTDLQQAVLVANNLVQCGQTEIGAGGVLGTCPAGSAGKGEVSMSWGGGEFMGENASDACANLDDSCFTTPNIVYFASSGDSPGVSWPSTSPNVVSAGGLTNRRNPSTFDFIGQTPWVDAGGGQSAIEAQPGYQKHWGVQAACGTMWRCVPDLSFDADPYTGVYVYDSFTAPPYVWWVIGGTSLSAPALAGIVNRAGSFAASSNAELTKIYNNMSNSRDFTDVFSGYCGFYMGFSARFGWDFCTGIGADKGYEGK
jgi:subtilase family serine protease